MQKTAFVTGATGFVGLNLVEMLLQQGGWQVVALHRPSSRLKVLKKIAPDVRLVEGSITDLASLLKAMPPEADAVFHVAANTNQWKKGNSQQYKDNVVGTANMVQAALNKGVKKFIHTSSHSAFGIHPHAIDENTPSNALSCGLNYAETKYLSELEVLIGVEHGLQACILNPNKIMGQYDTSSWAQLILAVRDDRLPGIPPGGGMFCHVKDVVQAHINAVSMGRNGHRYLLGGQKASFLQVINLIQQQLGKPLSKKTTPAWALRVICFFMGIASEFTGKEPRLTPEKLSMLVRFPVCNYQKAVQELNFQTSAIETMIADTLLTL